MKIKGLPDFVSVAFTAGEFGVAAQLFLNHGDMFPIYLAVAYFFREKYSSYHATEHYLHDLSLRVTMFQVWLAGRLVRVLMVGHFMLGNLNEENMASNEEERQREFIEALEELVKEGSLKWGEGVLMYRDEFRVTLRQCGWVSARLQAADGAWSQARKKTIGHPMEYH